MYHPPNPHSTHTVHTEERRGSKMGTVLFSQAPITPQLHSQNRALSPVQSTRRPPPPAPTLIKLQNHRCSSSDTTKNSTNSSSNDAPSSSSSTRDPISEPQNLFLKTAWYGSELLGIAASFFRSPSTTLDNPPVKPLHLAPRDGLGSIDRAIVVQTIKDDFGRSYFVTGALTLDAYEEDCEFADPASSFKGLRRFKRNCTNFGSLIEKSSMKLMKWEDLEDKGIGHWRFSCTMSFPWKPILSATGYTEYYFDIESGKVCRHVEHWNVPKAALFKQLLKPSRGFWGNKT